jgi:hypothetical protein
MTDLVKDWMSSAVMRPFRPEPLTSSSGTPSSRANLRTEGEACGRPSAGVAVGLWAGRRRPSHGSCGGHRAAGRSGAAATGRRSGRGRCGARSAAAPSRIASRSPMLTLSPTLTLSSLSTPACEDGISIEALSDSTVIRLCSTLMVSPGLTNTSITATSLKSPMSGTRTSTGPAAQARGRRGHRGSSGRGQALPRQEPAAGAAQRQRPRLPPPAPPSLR